MAKYHGLIGWVTSQEAAAGVWKDVASERKYYGDILRDTKQWSRTDQVNDDLVIDNRISIVADDFAFQNVSTIRYARMGGGLWKVTRIEIQRPRLILTLGGVYNGPTP